MQSGPSSTSPLKKKEERIQKLSFTFSISALPMKEFLQIFPLLFVLSLIPSISAQNDTLERDSVLRDGETLVSSGGLFALGFFNPVNSTNRYVGIWYNYFSIQTVVWVANRRAPLTTNSSVLRITDSGLLAILDRDNGTIVWSTNAMRPGADLHARLLDSGNLVVKDPNDDRRENFVWQSFDFPCDTFLAGIEMGMDYVTGRETFVSAWTSETDPAPGQYSMHMDPTGYPQMVLRNGTTVRQRVGPWNGLRWSKATDTSFDSTYQVILWMNRNESKYTERFSQYAISMSRLSHDDDMQRRVWNYGANSWTVYTSEPKDICDIYKTCGAHGNCIMENSLMCDCLDRFVPRDRVSWNMTDWTSGCVRRVELNCFSDIFLRYPGIKLPDSRNATFNDRIIRLADCEVECKRNCTCMAYTQLNISGSGSGCLFYHGELSDIRTMAQAGQDLFIRLAALEAPPAKSRTRTILIATLTSVASVILVCLSLVFILTRKRKKQHRLGNEGPFSGHHVIKDSDLPFFSLSTVKQATDNFSNNNKLGEGGFGPVYKAGRWTTNHGEALG